MNLKDLQEKPESTKKKIIIGVAIVLVLILGVWWFQDTRQHLKEVQQEGIDIELPATEQTN